MNRKLYLVTAHGGIRADEYYVLAEGSTAAERAVYQAHADHGWYAIDYFSVATMAEESDTGKPTPLLIA